MPVGLCIASAGKTVFVAATAFSLSWVHSVERTEWREDWVVSDQALVLTQARVKGSGAGMDPGPGARLDDGWWIWEPALPPQPDMRLAASGATVSAWELCHAKGCLALGAKAGDGIRLWPCEGDAS
ncbi:DUF1850 domain-containing protein [Pseudohoeflea suaedae]|uniref:DUF1850 domain-containing protein n=1 Tax=Pseudohoeflea suaedae TaxID=877384 RepID=A0A4R5PJS2_9HYPH|nr:DUF1850 domain-containing protein [Pseudohoeflea suaedae]TDH35941.1 DUF1850 domain-containing protein [Pseudohoeflea suaedae]